MLFTRALCVYLLQLSRKCARACAVTRTTVILLSCFTICKIVHIHSFIIIVVTAAIATTSSLQSPLPPPPPSLSQSFGWLHFIINPIKYLHLICSVLVCSLFVFFSLFELKCWLFRLMFVCGLLRVCVLSLLLKPICLYCVFVTVSVRLSVCIFVEAQFQ